MVAAPQAISGAAQGGHEEADRREVRRLHAEVVGRQNKCLEFSTDASKLPGVFPDAIIFGKQTSGKRCNSHRISGKVKIRKIIGNNILKRVESFVTNITVVFRR